MATSSANDMMNANVCLTGANLVLVPYLKHHVPRYHDWLSREDILEATCSEPQSLEEEYENQTSWLEADDKMTFIILAPLSAAVAGGVAARRAIIEEAAAAASAAGASPMDVLGFPLVMAGGDAAASSSSSSPPLPACLLRAAVVSASKDDDSSDDDLTVANPLVMIGDCNIFKMPTHHTAEGEVEVSVMLAENRFRGKGLAREAVGLLMAYAYETLHRSSFIAKILASNEGSRNLFEKGSLGFSLFKEVKAFDEIHYMKRIRPYLSPESGAVVEVVTNTDGEVVAVAAAEEEAEKSGKIEEGEGKVATESSASKTRRSSPPIATIEALRDAVSYTRHEYSTDVCEKGRTMALTNATEKAFY